MLRPIVLTALCLAASGVGAHAQGKSGSDPLVTPAWLAAHARDPDLVLLHVGDKGEYDREHIPGARFVSQRDVAAAPTPDGLTLELPDPATLRERLAALGISDRSRVVVYYGNDWVSPATRIVFTLDYAGLGSRTALLDGGMPAWKRAGGAVTAELPAARRGELSALRVNPIVVDGQWVRTHLASRGVAIVDGRDASYYDGLEHPGHEGMKMPPAGHIPGAHSVPFTEVTDDSLRVRSRAELAALFAKAGVAPGDTVVAYCHIGQQGTAVVFAARLTGHPVRLYDGSFEDWSRQGWAIENPSAKKP